MSHPLNSPRIPINDGAKPRRSLKAVAGVALLALSATVGVSAWAQPGPGGHHGGGFGMGSMALNGSPDRVGRMVDHLLDGLNATDAQRAQIKSIAQAAAAELKPQRDASRALRERAMQLMSSPNLDANAAESLRQQMVAQHDQVSRRTLQAMLDMQRVLTPEQRAKLAERMKQRAERMKERGQRMERGAPKQ